MVILGILLALVLGAIMLYCGYYCFVGGFLMIIAAVTAMFGGKKKGD